MLAGTIRTEASGMLPPSHFSKLHESWKEAIQPKMHLAGFRDSLAHCDHSDWRHLKKINTIDHSDVQVYRCGSEVLERKQSKCYFSCGFLKGRWHKPQWGGCREQKRGRNGERRAKKESPIKQLLSCNKLLNPSKPSKVVLFIYISICRSQFSGTAAPRRRSFPRQKPMVPQMVRASRQGPPLRSWAGG